MGAGAGAASCVRTVSHLDLDRNELLTACCHGNARVYPQLAAARLRH